MSMETKRDLQKLKQEVHDLLEKYRFTQSDLEQIKKIVEGKGEFRKILNGGMRP